MARSLALLALSGALVAAQSTTVSIFMPLYDSQDLVASVVAADSDKTTYFVECPTTASASDCGVPDGGQTVIWGPSTMSYNYAFSDSEEGSYTQDIACQMNSKKDVITCSISAYQEYDGTTVDTSTVESTSGYLDILMPVTVTAGLNKLKDSGSSSETTAAAPASTAGSEDATATTDASSETSTSESESESSAASASSSDADATPSASDNAAGAMITQNAVLAGAAVLVGGAMLL